jgi:hypothetical protein
LLLKFHYFHYCYYCHKCHNCHNFQNCHNCHCRIGRYVGRFNLPFDTLKVIFHKAFRPTDRRTDGRTNN